MSTKDLDDLLERMSGIASAVNAFSAESVQQQALEGLISAFFGRSAVAPSSDSGNKHEAAPVNGESSESAALARNNQKPEKKPRKSRGNSSARDHVEAIRSLDLRPNGKQAFADFVEEKQPSSNQDKFAVAIYWLEQIAEVSPITISHVAAVFKQTNGWRESGNIRVGLTSTASRKNTIDTSDLENLKTTPHGRNFVLHDLPPKAKAKASKVKQ